MPASASAESLRPYTGRECLDSLDDGREVWIYGERVKTIAEHPAFRNAALQGWTAPDLVDGATTSGG